MIDRDSCAAGYRRRALKYLLAALVGVAPLACGFAEEPTATAGEGGEQVGEAAADPLIDATIDPVTDPVTDPAIDPAINQGSERERQLQLLRERIEQQRLELERARELSREVQEDVDQLRLELDESQSRLREKRGEVERLRERATLGDE